MNDQNRTRNSAPARIRKRRITSFTALIAGSAGVLFMFIKRTRTDIVFRSAMSYNLLRFPQIQRDGRSMNEKAKATRKSWKESHPRLTKPAKQDEDDPAGEVIRHTPDELCFTRRKRDAVY